MNVSRVSPTFDRNHDWINFDWLERAIETPLIDDRFEIAKRYRIFHLVIGYECSMKRAIIGNNYDRPSAVLAYAKISAYVFSYTCHVLMTQSAVLEVQRMYNLLKTRLARPRATAHGIRIFSLLVEVTR